jgi:hypothetical protein
VSVLTAAFVLAVTAAGVWVAATSPDRGPLDPLLLGTTAFTVACLIVVGVELS